MVSSWWPSSECQQLISSNTRVLIQISIFKDFQEDMRFLRTFKISAEHDCPADFWEVVIYDVELCWLPDRLIKTQCIAVRGVLRRFKDPPPDPVEPLALGIQQVKNIFWNIYPVGIMEKWKKITGGVIGALLLLVIIVLATVVSLNARWTAS